MSIARVYAEQQSEQAVSSLGNCSSNWELSQMLLVLKDSTSILCHE